MPIHFESGTPMRVLEERRTEVERTRDGFAQYFKIHGEFEVYGSGEGSSSVNFPIRFSDKPVMHFGSELAPGDTYTTGALPTANLTVLSWAISPNASGTVTYVGADFGVVTTGSATQTMIVFWSVEGVGVRNPTT